MCDGQKCRGGQYETEKCGTNLQGWKMQDNQVCDAGFEKKVYESRTIAVQI